MPRLDPIHTARLVIREFTLADREALFPFVRDPSQLEHMLLDLTTEAELDAFLSLALDGADAEPRLEWHCAVETARDRRFVGSCCLMVERDAPSSAELGYWFAREAWGNGYATEAATAMLKLGFERLRLHRVWGKCHERNPASARVMQKLGMRHEGTVREHVWLRDHYRTSHVFAMLEGEYRRATDPTGPRQLP